MISEIQKILVERGQTLAFAESCTGGKLSGDLASSPGVSIFYLGSIIAYSNSLKEKLLGVSPSLIKSVGAVSSPVALAMAKGAKALTGAAWAVSITGIAGPSGGTKEKPVGTVWFGLVGPGIEATGHRLFTGDRAKVQDQAVRFAKEFLLQHLKGEKNDRRK